MIRGLFDAWVWIALLAGVVAAAPAGGKANNPAADAILLLGQPDGSAMEFGLTDKLWPSYAKVYPNPIVFTVGKSSLN